MRTADAYTRPHQPSLNLPSLPSYVSESVVKPILVVTQSFPLVRLRLVRTSARPRKAARCLVAAARARSALFLSPRVPPSPLRGIFPFFSVSSLGVVAPWVGSRVSYLLPNRPLPQ